MATATKITIGAAALAAVALLWVFLTHGGGTAPLRPDGAVRASTVAPVAVAPARSRPRADACMGPRGDCLRIAGGGGRASPGRSLIPKACPRLASA